MATTSTLTDNPPPSDDLQLTNRLGSSRSPYVRGHMGNPVAWQEWNPESLELAKKHDRLIFLSIGYAACHWCHVMERESFENEEIAAIMNRSFISIKVDREERPDLDRIYMNYLQGATGSAGWPLNVFLTPDLEPLFGGTYWPGPASTTAHRDHVVFSDILAKMEDIWSTQRERCRDSAKGITIQLKEFAQEGLFSKQGIKKEETEKSEELDIDLLEEAVTNFTSKFDPVHGGFSTAPKFPTPTNLRFLLALIQYPSVVKDVVGENDIEKAKQMVLLTLDKMWNGGIKDQIGHGFARYSATSDWSLPHFEKMLYDQAQLLQTYIDAYLITQNPNYLEAVLDIATYLTSPPIAAQNGGFYSSEDADSLAKSSDTEKHEGAFYVWTRQELVDILGEREADIASKYWGVEENGNVPQELDAHDELIQMNVLSVKTDFDALAKSFSTPKDKIIQIIEEAKVKLRTKRETRPRPALDDKIVCAWNGLAIGALARSSSILVALDDDKYKEQAKKFLTSAQNALAFIKQVMRDESTGHLKRVWREGPGEVAAFADDYAFLISGLIHLYEATWDDSYLQFADELQKLEIELFWDSDQGGFYSTADKQADLILRLKDGLDSTEPSLNGYSARNLFRLASFLEDTDYVDKAKRTLHAFEAEILQHPHLFSGMLDSVVSERLGLKSLVISGSGQQVEDEIKALRKHTGIGRTIVRIGGGTKDDFVRQRNHLVKAMNPDKLGVQVCENGVCKEILIV